MTTPSFWLLRPMTLEPDLTAVEMHPTSAFAISSAWTALPSDVCKAGSQFHLVKCRLLGERSLATLNKMAVSFLNSLPAAPHPPPPPSGFVFLPALITRELLCACWPCLFPVSEQSECSVKVGMFVCFVHCLSELGFS